jgi:hypothetical protein
MKRGIKHLIECHCTLPQFKGNSEVVYHKFTVFSIIDESDTVVPKTVTCNNCGAAHRVIDICKSTIDTSREDSKTVRTIDDIKVSLPPDLSDVLKSYNCDVATYEHAEFIMDYEMWGDFIVLNRENTGEGVEGKILRFKSAQRFIIEPFLQRTVVG